MSLSVFGIGKAVCDASSQLGFHSLSQSACFQPSSFGAIITLSTAALLAGLAYRYWRISAP